MTEEPTTESQDGSENDAISALGLIAELTSDAAIPVVPAPIKRNLFKALAQLSSAIIDFPVAHLTGLADERRAETAARISLINTSAEQIAQQMQTDSEYAHVAVHKFGQRILREQINLDMIAQRTAVEIWDAVDANSQEGSIGEIDEDWLNTFEAEGRLKNSEEMHVLFGRILAGEIKRPGSFSTRAIRILGSLDQGIAKHFVTLCSISISQLNDSRVPSLGGDAGDNALRDYGLGFDILNMLNEHGLIISSYNSWVEMTPFRTLPGLGQQAVCIPFSHQGQYWSLMPTSNDVKSVLDNKIRVHGVVLTQVGRELSRIVEVTPMTAYTEKLARYFEGQGFRMTEVDDETPRVIEVQ